MGERQFRSGQTKLVVNAADTEEPPQTKNQNMKTLTKLTLAVTMLLASVALSNAQGYHYVRPYYRHDGTYVQRSLSDQSGRQPDTTTGAIRGTRIHFILSEAIHTMPRGYGDGLDPDSGLNLDLD